MARVLPFAGVRFDAGRVPLTRALCPPYDVIPDILARRLRAIGSNAIHLELPSGGPGERYRRAARTWKRWARDGVLVRDPLPAYYLLEQRFRRGAKTLRRLGLLAALGLEDAGPGRVMAHEKTLAKPKKDRLRVIRTLRVNTSPIFCLYADPSGAVRRLLSGLAGRRPDASGRSPDGVRVRLWRVDGLPAAAALRRAFEPKRLLIADGHHRFEVARAYFRSLRGSARAGGGAASVLAYLCAEEDPGLLVLPTHRALSAREPAGSRLAASCRLMPMKSLAALEAALSRHRSPCAFGAWADGFFLAVPRFGAKGRLGVEWLARELLAGVDPHGIRYTHEAAEAVRWAKGSRGAAFLVKAISVGRIRRAVEMSGLLPQKSTYFIPKVPTGVVFKALE